MERKLDVFVKQPGKAPRHTAVSNSLKALQNYVEGFIEVYPLDTIERDGKRKDIIVICNEEGRIIPLEWNCRFGPVDFVGPIIICGLDENGEEFDDVPLNWAEFKKMYPQLWEG